MARVLVIDDDEGVRQSVAMILGYEGHDLLEAPEGAQGLELACKAPRPDVVLLDIKMPGRDGLDVLKDLTQKAPECAVVMISGHGTSEAALEATRRGAFDFLEKPLDRDRLLLAVRNASRHHELSQANSRLRQSIEERHRIFGESAAITELRATIERIAPTDARVLVTGENGTGKELVARNLHVLSTRSDAAWIDLNCAAIPAELIESELFGHEKGAFTGADQRRAGAFERADGGTLFLDEIGDMPLEAQAKVLRALQEGQVRRVGGGEELQVDARIVAATNKDLAEEVAAGRFREDLFYRLAVIPIAVPPLRERGRDVEILFSRFLVETCRAHGRPTMRCEEEALAVLRRHAWPGNVRELRNLAERAVLLVGERILDAAALSRLLGRPTASEGNTELFAIPDFETFKETAERLYLSAKLVENGWNVKRTAESLGMQRSNLYKKIDRHDLRSGQAGERADVDAPPES